MRAFTCSLILLATLSASAQQGVLVVHVRDMQGHPIGGVRLRAGRDSSVSPATQGAPKKQAVAGSTETYGQARIQLAAGTKPGDPVILELVSPGDLVFLSPFDGWITVPAFDNAASSFVSVVLVKRNERARLENDDFVKALTAEINKKTAEAIKGALIPRADPLQEVAARFGVSPDDVDRAIREWSKKAKDIDERAQAALYAQDYPAAEKGFAETLRNAEQRENAARAEVAEQAMLLGFTLSKQGKLEEAAASYQKAFEREANILTAVAYGRVLLQLDRVDDAAKIVDPMIAKFRPMAAADPRTHGIELVFLLGARSAIDGRQGHEDSARKLQLESHDVLIRVMEASPEDYEPLLYINMKMVRELAMFEDLDGNDDFDRPIMERYWNEVLDAYEPIVKKDAFYERYRAVANASLGMIASERDDWVVAHRYYERGLELFKRAAKISAPKQHRERLTQVNIPEPVVAEVTLLCWLAELERSLNRLSESSAHFEEALRKARALARKDAAHQAELAEVLVSMAGTWWEEEQWCTGDDAMREAVSIYRALVAKDDAKAGQGLASALFIRMQLAPSLPPIDGTFCSMLVEAWTAAKGAQPESMQFQMAASDAIADGKCTAEELDGIEGVIPRPTFPSFQLPQAPQTPPSS
jgi:tetratricopeptide (TPR) repeat protein